MIFKKRSALKILLFLYFSALFAFLVCLSLQRYFIGQLYFYDFGIFSQILWRLSRFSFPYINHLVLGKIHFLGDHFEPSLFLLTPIYWISSGIIILPLEQAAAIFGNAVLIYLIARRYKLSVVVSLMITSIFIIFSGTLNPLLTDWHTEPTAGLFLLLFYYLYSFTDKTSLAVLTGFIFLGFKESNSITLFFILFYLLFVLRNKRKLTLFLLLICPIWFFLTTKILIPNISRAFYLYAPEISFNPVVIFNNILGSNDKTKLIFNSLISFGFIPLISGMAIVPILGELGIRVVPVKSLFQNFTLGFHYNVFLGIVLTISMIITVVRLKNQFKKIKSLELLIAFFILIFSLVTARKITASPMNMMISPIFWRELKPNKEFFEFIGKIPKKGTVTSQNNILAYVSNRIEDLYYIKKNYPLNKPDIIAFDLTPGQNPNNFYESEPENLNTIRTLLLKDPNYKLLYKQGDNRYIFVKNKQY